MAKNMRHLILSPELQDQRRLGFKEGYKEGYAESYAKTCDEALIDSIKALMETMNLSAVQAMNVLDVHADKQKRLITRLQKE